MKIFNSLQQKYKPLIENSLYSYIELFNVQDTRSVLKQAMSYSITAKAKRIRPLLTIAVFELFSKDIKKILPVCSAIEMIHTYSLIHDDLPAMDNDDYRRGQLTCHKKFGEDIAILAGDTLNTYAFEIMANDLQAHYKPKQILDAIVLLAKSCGMLGMAGGQVMDLRSPLEKDYSYLKQMHSLKTGALLQASICVPVVLEAADNKIVKIFNDFGYHLGLIFQIVDDILDVTGKKEVLGKSPQKDTQQNKLTYVKLFGLEGAKKLLSEEVEQALGSLDQLKNLNTSVLREIIEYLVDREF